MISFVVSTSRRVMASVARRLLVLALPGVLAGCGLPGGGMLNTGTNAIGDEKGPQYAFSRARVPITIEGQVAPRRLTLSTTPTFTHKVTISLRPAKYAIDTGLAKSIGRRPGDRFTAEIGTNRLLRSVSPSAAPANPLASDQFVTGAAPPATAPAPAGAEIADFGGMLKKSLPTGPSTSALSRTLPRQLAAFRIDTEIDPAVPSELETLKVELNRVARDWGLKVTFDPVPVDVAINGRTVTLAASAANTHCSEPICFRVPVPYRLRVEPLEMGWRGKLEANIWLPNNGPLGAIDVRNPLFVDKSGHATFENGMLRSVQAADAQALEALLRVPTSLQTANSRRR